MYATDMWLDLGDGVSLGVNRSEVMAYTRDDFVGLLFKHVFGVSVRDAEAWADKQIELRSSATSVSPQTDATENEAAVRSSVKARRRDRPAQLR